MGLKPWHYVAVVQRTFAWIGRDRPHNNDYETLTEANEAHVRLTMTHLMLRRNIYNRLTR